MTRRQAAAALTAALVVLVAGRALGAELDDGEQDYDAITTQTVFAPVVVAIPPTESSAP